MILRPGWIAGVGLLLASCSRPPQPEPRPLPPPQPVEAKPPQAIPSCPKPTPSEWVGLPAGIDTSLWVSLDSLFQSDFAPSGGILGAYVGRLGDSSELWTHLPDARMLPASTQKVYTAAAGLALLGGDFRWRTTLWRTGTIKDGELHGDLVVEGGGDPTLNAENGALGVFLNGITKAGIKSVHGNLVALDTLAGRGLDAWPGGWTVSSAKDGYGAPVVGLNWNQNRVGDRSLPEPRSEILKSLRKILASRDIAVSGSDSLVRARGDSVLARRSLTKLATAVSPELEPVLRNCLKESVNPYAEGVILGLGLGRRGPTRDAGLRRAREWLSRQGLDMDRMAIDDGSGLSRYDATSARQMARFLARDGRNQRLLLPLLPRGGEGTLRKRFRAFPDQAVVAAKTGTLDAVSNLAGYLFRAHDTLAFAFFCQGYAGPTRPVREFQDRLLTRLAGLPLRTILDTLPQADSGTSPGKPDSARLATTKPKAEPPQAPSSLPGRSSAPEPAKPTTVQGSKTDSGSKAAPAVKKDSLLPKSIPAPAPASDSAIPKSKVPAPDSKISPRVDSAHDAASSPAVPKADTSSLPPTIPHPKEKPLSPDTLRQAPVIPLSDPLVPTGETAKDPLDSFPRAKDLNGADL